jgi:hypothetical protein
MTFLHPYALAGAVAVPLAVLIALWRARRQEVTVPSLVLWDRLRERVAEAGQRRRRAIDLPLVLAAAFAALAVLASAGPLLVRSAPAGRHIVFVVDLSASLSARDPGGSTRWQKLQAELDRAMSQLRAEDRVTVLPWPEAAARPAARLTPEDTRRALDALRPADVPADISKAAPVALGYIAPGEAGRCVVFTDDPAPLGDELPPNLAVVAVGGPLDNVGIVGFAVEAGEVFAAILNRGPARDVPVELSADGKPVRTQSLRLAADTRRDLVWPVPQPEPKKLELRLSIDDTLAADNAAVAILRPPRALSVALIGPECEPLRRALNAMQDVIATGVAATDASAETFDLRIYYSVAPAQVPAGSAAFVAPGRDVGPLRVGAEAPAGELAAVATSPLLRDVDLSEIRIVFARPLDAPGLQPVARCAAGTVIATLTLDDSALIYVGFDFASATTDWPLRWSFPVFWANVVALARGSAPTGWLCERGSGAANLLDERETALGGAAVAFAPQMLGEAPTTAHTQFDASAWLAAGALVSALAHWRAKR